MTEGIPSPCNIAVDTEGHVYVAQGLEGPLLSFETSDFAAGVPTAEGTQIDTLSRAAYVDPETNLVYVDEGDRIAVFDPSGNLVQRFGSGDIGSESRGVAINAATKHVYALTGSSIVDFGFETAPYIPIDNPAIRHGVDRGEVHSYGDFEVTPDGRYAVFPSLLPLTGYDSNDRMRCSATTRRQGVRLRLLQPDERPRLKAIRRSRPAASACRRRACLLQLGRCDRPEGPRSPPRRLRVGRIDSAS